METEDEGGPKSTLRIVESLKTKTRELEDEIQRLRPLARLAEVIAVMEGANHRQFDELAEADRKYEDLYHGYMNLLEDRINRRKNINDDEARQRRHEPPPGGGAHP